VLQDPVLVDHLRHQHQQHHAGDVRGDGKRGQRGLDAALAIRVDGAAVSRRGGVRLDLVAALVAGLIRVGHFFSSSTGASVMAVWSSAVVAAGAAPGRVGRKSSGISVMSPSRTVTPASSLPSNFSRSYCMYLRYAQMKKMPKAGH